MLTIRQRIGISAALCLFVLCAVGCGLVLYSLAH